MEGKNSGCDVGERDAGTLWPLLLPLPNRWRGAGPFPVAMRIQKRSFDRTLTWPQLKNLPDPGENIFCVHAISGAMDAEQSFLLAQRSGSPGVKLIYEAAHTDIHYDAERQKRKQHR